MKGLRRTAGVVAAFGAALLLGACSLLGIDGDTEGTTVDDLTPVEAAVLASDPAVLEVAELDARVNGLGRALFASLVIDGDDPMDSGQLRTIVEAIWTTVPFKPNALRIVAVRPHGRGSISLESAAEALMPGEWRPFGDRGVSLLDADVLLGPWKAP